jgi:phenylacetic acid degradation operon negative regulatory protein
MLPGVQPQDLTVTLLGNQLLHLGPDATAWSGGLVEILGRFGFSAEAARAALARLAKRGVVERVRAGREISYRLSSRSRGALVDGEARILRFGRTERGSGDEWTVVSYTLPDRLRTERDRLRNRLAFLGFGALRDGAWIASGDRAGDVATALDALRITEFAEVFVGRAAGATDPAALLKRVWDLDALDAAYRAFLAEIDGWDLGGGNQAADPLATRAALMHRYRNLLIGDPDLPSPLLPPASARPLAVEQFHRAWHGLAPAAATAFAQLCRTGDHP